VLIIYKVKEKNKMKKSSKVYDMSKVKLKKEDELKTVTRKELVEVITQMGDAVGDVQMGLVDAVNTMYKQQVFPFQLELWALEELLKEKGIITEEEMQKKLQERKQYLLDKAQQVKENKEGKLEITPEDEAKEKENKAVLKALKSEK
jgi:L-arabinose isomerase